MIVVVDGSGDFASTSLYLGENGAVRQIRCNESIFDSLGMFYGVISSTQGGWTTLSSEGRYMGATAYGDMDRATNPFYPRFESIFDLRADGEAYLNRSLANWPRRLLGKPYTRAHRHPGAAHRSRGHVEPRCGSACRGHSAPAEYAGKARQGGGYPNGVRGALFHIIDGLIRKTGSDRLVLTGGAALNAAANMRVLEHFDADYFGRVLKRPTRLHLWVPPVPGNAGVTVGAAYAFAAAAGARGGANLEHAFYCGRASRLSEILFALEAAADVDWIEIGDASRPAGVEAIADFMAFITARDGIIALFQGPAETGPRALGHRSILANPRNPQTRELLNARVKYREAIRPLAPMATLSAAKDLFDLSEGASDDDYNAYNYMVLTVRAKPQARALVPAVIHADGTARVQIVRERADPVTMRI